MFKLGLKNGFNLATGSQGQKKPFAHESEDSPEGQSVDLASSRPAAGSIQKTLPTSCLPPKSSLPPYWSNALPKADAQGQGHGVS